MDNVLTVSYFKCDSQKGNDLFQRAKSMLENMDLGDKKIEIVLRTNNPFVSTEAYLCDDVVIFDGSLEDEEFIAGNKTGMQYDAMIEPMKSAPHVLIVSRSQIPVNVMCVHKGGYPNYIRTGTAEYKETFDNEEILDWLREIFARSGTDWLNPYKLQREYYQGLSESEKGEVLSAVIKKNMNESEKTPGEEEVFVSYLSRYSQYFQGEDSLDPEYTVEDLIRYISNAQGIDEEHIGYFPPGNLSRELMTVQRRWEIISATDDFIRKCRQFWILAAPGYAKSWWTLSERITLSYILDGDPEQCPDIYVARHDPETGSFRVEKYLDIEAKKKFLPKLGKDTIQELARYFANSRQGTVGYENIWIMKLMHYLPDSAIRSLSGRVYKMAEEVMPAIAEAFDGAEEYAETAVHSAKSDVYTKSFWEDWIMECPYCKEQSRKGQYNKGTFLNPKKSGFCHIVKKHDISYDAKKDRYKVVCRSCKHPFYLKKGCFYRWYPIRGAYIHTGPRGGSIEKRTAYYFAGPDR